MMDFIVIFFQVIVSLFICVFFLGNCFLVIQILLSKNEGTPHEEYFEKEFEEEYKRRKRRECIETLLERKRNERRTEDAN